jgi:hypothetical protein
MLTILGVTFTLLTCFEKWGWIDLYTTYRKRWMPEGDCWLCLSFWISWPVTGLYYLLQMFHMEWVLIPFAVCALINLLQIIKTK